MKTFFFMFAFTSFTFLTSCNMGTKQNATNNTETEVQATSENTSYIAADRYDTSGGELELTLVGHGSVMFEYGGKTIHVDPYSKVADYDKLPDADLIIITHEHQDHLDTTAINKIKKDDTRFIVSAVCAEMLGYGDIIGNGENTTFGSIAIDAVPAYNMVHKKEDGEFYHPKGRGNGYVFTFGDKKVYVAGDTENIPEMEQLNGEIEIAFLPKNLPYTMDDDMFIDAAKKVSPKYLYPYHMSEFNEEKIKPALEGTDIEILVRPMSHN